MSLLQGFETIRLVKVGPSWAERLERRIAMAHHKAMLVRLRRFRERLERDMAPDPWTSLQAPMVLLLSDLCEALGLTENERSAILGQEGMVALHRELAIRPIFLFGSLNKRQVAALTCVRKHGKINLSTYRAICPFWSDETLRLDLADLVAQGLLIKNGAKRGTHYMLAE